MSLVIGLLPAILWSGQQLLMAAFPTSIRRQNVAVMIGAGLTSLLVSLIVGGHWSARALVWGTAAGLLWSAGQLFVLPGYRAWGVSRVMPTLTAIQMTVSSVIGIAVLAEWRAPGAMPLGIASLVAIAVAALACGWQEPDGPGPDAAARRTGIAMSAGAAVCFGVYPALMRLGGVSTADGIGPMGIGLLIGALIVAATFPKDEPLRGPRIPQGLGAGLVWGLGNLAVLYSTSTIGVAASVSLAQLSTIFTTVIGILVLGERKSRAEAWVTAAGVLSGVVGVVLLGLASAR